MHLNSYLREDTGSSISWPELQEIPFPALSICERFYDIGDIDRDLRVQDIVDVDVDNCTDSTYKLYTVGGTVPSNGRYAKCYTLNC